MTPRDSAALHNRVLQVSRPFDGSFICPNDVLTSISHDMYRFLHVSFYIAQQSGRCSNCSDPEAWKMPMDCPHHSPHLTNLSHVTPKSSTRTIIPEVPPIPNHPYRINVPPELRDSVHRTIGYALDFLLDMLDYSPEEPNNEADLRLVTTPANSVER